MSPDVFANNRLSSALDTGRSVKELLARFVLSLLIHGSELRTISPELKHIGTFGLTSHIEHAYDFPIGRSYITWVLMCFHSLDAGFKSSTYLTETLLDPELGHAYESNKTAFNKALNVEEDNWSWLERPENRLRLTRFGASMNGLKNSTPAVAILEGSVTQWFIHCTPLSHL